MKRHPVGIIVMYVMTAIVLTVIGVMALVVAPAIFTTADSSQVRGLGAIAFLAFAMLCLLFNLVSTVVYWGNRWILTDDSITQITQLSLFRKETSSLGLESLEDVTVKQNGILTHIFNYGVLVAETAGHHSKFVFAFAPNPNQYAQTILEAREKEDVENRQLTPTAAYAAPAAPPTPGSY